MKQVLCYKNCTPKKNKSKTVPTELLKTIKQNKNNIDKDNDVL